MIMKRSPITRLLQFFLWAVAIHETSTAQSAYSEPVEDPLPSWNEGPVKQSIIAFVKQVTDSASADFVSATDRVACFDNDGTLWAEQPMYFQLFFVMDRVRAMAPQHPEWKNQQPFKVILEGDIKTALASGEKAIGALLMATHAGMTDEEFNRVVRDWVATAKHPQTKKGFTQMVYQPMLELLDYLRANRFTTFIVSGGGIDFMQPWTQQVYGVPPNQVVGSSLKVKYEVRNGQPVIVRLPEVNFVDDKAGKPAGIHQHIGKRPVFTAGNSDGDYEMLQWTSTGTGPQFGLLIHHTDPVREWAYDRNSSIGTLDKGLNDAPKYKWRVVDM